MPSQFLPSQLHKTQNKLRQNLAVNWRRYAPLTPHIAFFRHVITLLESQPNTPFLGQLKTVLTGPEFPVGLCLFHQRGLTDYATLCRLVGEAGVEKWVCDLLAMTCSYFDKSGRKMHVELIPTGEYKS